jgi:tight adherence protein B
MGILVVIVVGVVVASVVAFAANTLLPSSDSTATEDRLAAMASRRRDTSDTVESGSLMAGDWDDDNHPLAKLMKNMPALQDYMEQADVQLAPSKFAFVCLAAFGGVSLRASSLPCRSSWHQSSERCSPPCHSVG